MTGKQKCAILKQIRRDIAAKNDINITIEECTHKGNCRGTCPRCEAEVRILERELEKRRKAGARTVLAGVSAGLLAASLTSCSPVEKVQNLIEHLKPPVEEELEGDVLIEPDPEIEQQLPGDPIEELPPAENEPGEPIEEELEGDVPFEPEPDPEIEQPLPGEPPILEGLPAVDPEEPDLSNGDPAAEENP